MKKSLFYFIVLSCILGFSACLKETTTSTPSVSDPVQSKVNVGNLLIVPDNRADNTNPPFTTYSATRSLINAFWNGTVPDLSLNDNVFRIEDIATLFEQTDKVVFVVEGISEKNPSFHFATYEALKDKLSQAHTGNTYYYILEKASFNRQPTTATELSGIIYMKDDFGNPVTHIATRIGSRIKDNQTWFYLILDAVKFDEDKRGTTSLRPDTGGGVEIPQT